jgi:hypothetical protein
MIVCVNVGKWWENIVCNDVGKWWEIIALLK